MHSFAVVPCGGEIPIDPSKSRSDENVKKQEDFFQDPTLKRVHALAFPPKLSPDRVGGGGGMKIKGAL